MMKARGAVKKKMYLIYKKINCEVEAGLIIDTIKGPNIRG